MHSWQFVSVSAILLTLENVAISSNAAATAVSYRRDVERQFCVFSW